MTYILLTSDCQFFNAEFNEYGQLLLTWNMSANLSSYKKICIKEIQIGPLTIRRHDVLLEIHSNIIARTLYNPLRQLATVRVSRNSSFIDGLITSGMFQAIELIRTI